MEDCLFCRIQRGEIPSQCVYQDEKIYAFRDIDPKAPTHFLVIPRMHIPSAASLDDHEGALVGEIFTRIAKIAQELRLEKGFRVVTNVGVDGGQTVSHLHFHVLAGRALSWPPG